MAYIFTNSSCKSLCTHVTNRYKKDIRNPSFHQSLSQNLSTFILTNLSATLSISSFPSFSKLNSIVKVKTVRTVTFYYFNILKSNSTTLKNLKYNPNIFILSAEIGNVINEYTFKVNVLLQSFTLQSYINENEFI